jgi:hypothetical protein
MGRERIIAISALRRRSRTREDSYGIGPVQEDIQSNADHGRSFTCSMVSKAELLMYARDSPMKGLFDGLNPIVASTHTAHVVILYTKTSGK